jgi:hypothetical protein
MKYAIAIAATALILACIAGTASAQSRFFGGGTSNYPSSGVPSCAWSAESRCNNAPRAQQQRVVAPKKKPRRPQEPSTMVNCWSASKADCRRVPNRVLREQLPQGGTVHFPPVRG